jgi:hypothetical protein
MKKVFTNPSQYYHLLQKISYVFILLCSFQFNNYGQYAFTNNLPLNQIAGTGTAIPTTYVLQQIPIGFSFNFYGNSYTDVYLSPDGYLQFGTGLASATPASSGNIADAQFYANKRNLIAFAWGTDVKPGVFGNPVMDYFTTGTAPNRVLVINFKEISLNNIYIASNPDALISVQLQLYEGSNTIEVHNIKNNSYSTNPNISGFTTYRTFGVANSTGTSSAALSGYNNSNTFSLENKTVRIQNCTPESAPTISASTTTLTCGRDAVTLTASGCAVGSSVVWSNGKIGNSITERPKYTSSYSATCITANHCVGASSASQTITVTNLTPSIIYIGSLTKCPNATKFLNAVNITGANGEVVQWYRNGVALSGVTGSTYYADSVATFHVVRNIGTCAISSDSVTLIRGQKPDAPVISGSSTSCSLGSPITLTANGCSGTVTWTSGSTGNSETIVVSPFSPTNYQATCTDADGCVSTPNSPFLVSPAVVPIPVISSNVTSVCGGDTVTFTATGCSGIVKWSGSPTVYGNTVKKFVGASTGFSAQCIINGCPGFSSNTLNITLTNPITNVSALSSVITNGVATICENDTLSITASTSQTGGTWQWYKNGVPIALNGTSNIYKASQIGAYQAGYITSCTAKSFPISVSTLTRPTEIPVITSTITNLCSTGSVALKASGCTNYGWYSNGINNNYSGSSVSINQSSPSTVYTARCVLVNASTFTQCPSISTNASNPIKVTINSPSNPTPTGLTASSNTVTCGGNTSITLTATGCTDSYLWSSNANTTTTSASISVIPTATTAYSVKCKNNSTGCLSPSSSSTTITVTNALPTIAPSDTISACPGTSGQILTATTSVSGGTLQWSNDGGNISGATGTTYTAMTTENYKVTQTIGACTLSSKSVRVLIGQVKAPKITGNSTTYCSAGFYGFSATGCTGTVTWYNGSTGSNFSTYIPKSTYIWAKCSMGVGCESPKSDSINVAFPFAEILPKKDSVICVGNSYQLSVSSPLSGLTYQWYRDGSPILGATSSTYTVTDKGAYSVSVGNSTCVFGTNMINVQTISSVSPTITGNTSACTLSPDKLWDKRFGGTNQDFMKTMLPYGANGYLLGGTSSSGANGDKSLSSFGGVDSWVIKTDSNGIKLWDRRYGGSGDDFLVKMLPTPDGNLLLGGRFSSGTSGGNIASYGKGGVDYGFVKLDMNGNPLWDKKIGGTDNDVLTDMVNTPDNGFLLGGYSLSPSGGDKTSNNQSTQYDFWVVKTDNNGNKLWDKNFGNFSSYNNLKKIVPMANTFLLCGDASSYNFGQPTPSDFAIVKIDSIGNKIWEKSINGSSDDVFFDAVSVTGGTVLVGKSNSNSNINKTENSKGGYDYWLIKIDNNGTILWDKTIGGSGEDVPSKIKTLADGSLIIVGTSNSNISGDKTENSKGGNDYWIVKTDANGNKIWDKTIGGTGSESMADFLINRDNSYTLAGTSDSGIGADKTQGSQGLNDYWIVKASSCQTSNTPATVVDGQSITLKANGCNGIVTWSGGVTATGASVSVSPSTTTTYTATCAIAGCSTQSSTITLSVVGVPTPIITTSPSPALTCSGSPVTLTASGCPVGTVYNWTPSGQGSSMSISVSPATNTNYTVTCVVGTNTSSASTTVPVTNVSQVMSVASGDYNVPATWNCNCVPLPCSVVTINPTHNIVIPASITGKAKDVIVGGRLEIKPTGKLSLKNP